MRACIDEFVARAVREKFDGEAGLTDGPGLGWKLGNVNLSSFYYCFLL